MKIRRKKLVVAATVIVLLAGLLFVPLPMELNARDKERAVSHAIAALINNQRVITDKGYCRLEEATFMRKKTQIYFRNDLGISDSVFLKHGLKPAPEGGKVNLEDSGVIVFSTRDIHGKPVGNIQFAYVFGSMGAHGYEIRIRKSILMRYFSYTHQWIS
jgi:hypothetical protein